MPWQPRCATAARMPLRVAVATRKEGRMKKLILIAATILVPALTASAATTSSAPTTFDRSPCDRACLRAIAERYLNAVLAHDPQQAPLSVNVRYTENGVELHLPDGLWRTLGKVGSYRLTR